MKFWIPVIALVLSAGVLYADDFVIDEPQSDPSKTKANVPDMSAVKLTAISLGSVPTTATLPKGSFLVESIFYDEGGLTARAVVGILDFLSIGVSENFDKLIGSDSTTVNLPSAYVKLNVLNTGAFGIALGFDTFAIGRNGSVALSNGLSYPESGFFACAGWNYRIFRGPDFLSFGFRVPLSPYELPSLTNSSLFLGTSMTISDHFELGATIENLYLDFQRYDRILPSAIVTFMPIPEFRVFIELQYEFYSSQVNRILGLNYCAKF
jgi:hypothetical protein